MGDVSKERVNELTDAEFLRLAMIVKELARRNNRFAQAITEAWSNKPIANKKAIFARAYSSMFEILLITQMTLDSDKSVDEIKQSLKAVK